MAEANVEPVFRTRRQRLVRDVLLELGLALLFWVAFLRATPDVAAGVVLAGSGVVGALAMAARSRDLLRWPDRRWWSALAGGGLTTATILGLRYAGTETAWTVVGLSAGAVTARVLLYAGGAWRPGPPA